MLSQASILRALETDFVLNYPLSERSEFSCSQLRRSIFKKFTNGKSTKAADQEAIALFVSNNAKCASWDPRALMDLGDFISAVDDFFNPSGLPLLSFGRLTPFLTPGPGANVDTSSTDLYTKFVNSSMSASSGFLHTMYAHLVSYHPLLAATESFRSQRYGSLVVKGSETLTVPKTQDISRTICKEPLLNMFFQKAIGKLLEKRLKSFFNIDLSVAQETNRCMARIGSVDGSFGTIDLSSASDTLSLRLIRSIIPRESLQILERCRSTQTTLPGGEELELHMFSSMGNGYTFPLQTCIFACLCMAAYKRLGIPFRTRRSPSGSRNFAVFGDDIIVVKEAYDLVCEMLSSIGCTVNHEKSFNTGFFRESCGQDFYKGHNVRGVYLKKLLTDSDCYSAINRLNRWSAMNGIVLPNTVRLLCNGLRYISVPYSESDDAGVKVPRYLASVNCDHNGAYIYSAFVTSPRQVKLPSEKEYDSSRGKPRAIRRVRKVLQDFEYCPDGILLSFVAGWLMGGKLSLRKRENAFSLVSRVVPGWDYFGEGDASCPNSVDWEAYTAFNLFG